MSEQFSGEDTKYLNDDELKEFNEMDNESQKQFLINHNRHSLHGKGFIEMTEKANDEIANKIFRKIMGLD